MSERVHEGGLTIGRITRGRDDGEQIIQLQVKEVGSRARFLQLEMSLADFALALTGRSETPCTVTLRDVALVGLIRQVQDVMVEMPEEVLREFKVRSDWAPMRAIMAPFEYDGWKASLGILASSRPQTTPVEAKPGHVRVRVGFVRFVEPEDPDIE